MSAGFSSDSGVRRWRTSASLFPSAADGRHPLAPDPDRAGRPRQIFPRYAAELFHARDLLPDHRPARRWRAVGSGSASRTAFAAIRSAVPKPSVNRS